MSRRPWILGVVTVLLVSSAFGGLVAAGEQQPKERPKTEQADKRTEQADKKTDQADKKADKKTEQADKKTEFLRLARDKKKVPLALEAAIVRYVPQDCGKNSPTVDLVSAVHVAEKSYYEELNKAFRTYDVVLYELVAPEGTRVPRGGGNPDNPLSSIQTLMTDVLQLEYQLRAIDYSRPNMVHADLSPQQFAEAMRKRGESFWTMFLRMMGYAMSRQGQEGAPNDTALLMALFSKDRAMALKRVMAEQFQDIGGSLAAIEGPEGSAIITDRNKRALEVLRKQIGAGKKKIAIFYGAGHMPNMEELLRSDFGLVPIESKWFVAWDLKGPPPKPAAPAVKPARKPERVRI